MVVFLNEAEGVCESAESLSYGFSFRPQPAKVKVGVSYAGVVHGVDLVNAFVDVFMHGAVFVIERCKHCFCSRNISLFVQIETADKVSFHLVSTLAVKGYLFLCCKKKCHRQVVVVEVTDLVVFGGKIGVDKLGLENKVAVDAVVSAVHVQGERAVFFDFASQVKYAFACPRSLKYVTYTHNCSGNVKGSVIAVGKSLSVYVENNNGVLVLKFRRNIARQFEPSTTKFFICPKVTFFNLFKGVVF